MDIVKEVLEKQKKDLEKYKPITVEKHLEVGIDIGHLMVTDPNYFDEDKLRENQEQYLLDLTRGNTQLLVNSVWELPTERVEESVVVKLPPPRTVLPRARKLPVPKPLTKWEEIAKAKGIKKRTREKKVYDEVLDKWVPTYGYQRYKADKEKDWVLEVPQNADPNKDMFQEKRDLRIERIAKNEIARMRNIARVKKIQTPRTGFLGPESASAKELVTAVSIAKASTASVGVFQEKLSNEKQARGIGVKELMPGSKRKRAPITLPGEKKRNLEIVNKVLNKKPKIDVEKAISLQKAEARTEREAAALSAEGASKKKGKKSTKGTFSRKKPKGGQGKRNHSKRAVGRKRR
ncbi:ribosome biogenesis regulatory protein homolog [Toxorhynchites rutilus septentrionalis]|uniref:ribosome biogenesis regulatory protein homolog n=1 Tax=Toxorhynchites rutilus septentrionalis TaxID=329112 RepID=UPI0024795020|nr:ribosome biogenesis regulatory protein homolog [Toxorhynchites rutilus septentrionalis]